MDRLIDTNLLVYCYDPRFPEKRRIAIELLRDGLTAGTLVLPHQSVVEFVAAVSRPRPQLEGQPLLAPAEARRQAEMLLAQFPVIYPDKRVLTTALRGADAYQLPWFDAHLWAYAEANGIDEILSEDFTHGRHYGSVRAVDPFLAAAGGVAELPPLYEA